MEFTDVVMKRRAVRRFEEGGVDREVIERIARLAQRTPSAGFSQGQRLVVVTDPERRREVARICGEEYDEARLRAVDQRVRRPVHPVRQRGDLPPPLPGAGQGRRRRQRDRLAGPLLVGRHRRDDAEHHGWPRSTRGSAAASSGPRPRRRCGRTSAFPTSSRRSGSCRSAGRCRTSGHPASSEAGCRSRSSPAGSAGRGTDRPAGGVGGRPNGSAADRGTARERLTELQGLDTGIACGTNASNPCLVAVVADEDLDNVAIAEIEEDQPHALGARDGGARHQKVTIGPVPSGAASSSMPDRSGGRATGRDDRRS